MRARLLLASAAMIGLTAFAPLPFPHPKKPGAGSIEGMWEVVGTLRFNMPETKSPGKSLLRIEKGKWTFLRDGKSRMVYETTMDDKASLPTLDLGPEMGGKAPGRPSYLGIYKLEGNTMLWSYQSAGRGAAMRPTDFKPANPSHMTMKLQRVMEAKK